MVSFFLFDFFFVSSIARWVLFMFYCLSWSAPTGPLPQIYYFFVSPYSKTAFCNKLTLPPTTSTLCYFPFPGPSVLIPGSHQTRKRVRNMCIRYIPLFHTKTSKIRSTLSIRTSQQTMPNLCLFFQTVQLFISDTQNITPIIHPNTPLFILCVCFISIALWYKILTKKNL